MESNIYQAEREETIDLKELFFYILRKWKILLALVLVGAILGFGYASMQSGSSSSQSIQTYLISSDFFSADSIMAKLAALMQDDAALEMIQKESGVAVSQLRSGIEFEQKKTTPSPMASAETLSSVNVTVTITLANSEHCLSVAKAVDAHLLRMSEAFSQQYNQYKFEKLSDSLVTTNTPAPSGVKYALIGAVLLGFVAVAVYGVAFLMNGTVKTVDEIRSFFGLYPIAQLETGKKNRRLNSGALPVNGYDYLADALKAMKLENVLVCGDSQNADITAVQKWLSEQNEQYQANPALAVEGQLQAVEADAVVLCVQLWKTSKEALLREMEICRTLDKRIAGVIILK